MLVFGQLLPYKVNQRYQFVTCKRRFTSCNTYFLGIFRRSLDESFIMRIVSVYVITAMWRLTTHDASIVTLVGNEEHVAVGICFKFILHRNQLLKMGRTSSPRVIIKLIKYSMIALFFLQTKDVGRNPYISPCVE